MKYVRRIRVKQLRYHSGHHYALVESPEADYLLRLFTEKSWALQNRVARLETIGRSLVLLPTQGFCRSYWQLDGDNLSEQKFSKERFYLGGEFLVKRFKSSRVTEDKLFQPVSLLRADILGEVMLKEIDPFSIVSKTKEFILISQSIGLWESILICYRKVGQATWDKQIVPVTEHCNTKFLGWLNEYQVLIATDFESDYQRLFKWDLVSGQLSIWNDCQRDDFLYVDSNLCISNHRGYCEVRSASDTYETGFCEQISVGSDRLVLLAEQPATSQKIWSLQINDSTDSDSILERFQPETYDLDACGQLTPSLDFSFTWVSESLQFGQLIRFIPDCEPRASVIFIHGGPGLCEGLRMHELHTELIGNGFEIISYDASGSGGFGKSHRNRLNNKHGNLDLEELRKIIVEKARVQPIFLLGESYGGYLALKAGLEISHYLAGIINFYGVTDWVDAMLRLNHLPDSQRARIHDVFHDPNSRSGQEDLEKISILPRASELSIPILTIHGALDRSVPIDHSELLYQYISTAHKLNQLIILEDEGHCITKYSNRCKVTSECLKFLNACLRLA